MKKAALEVNTENGKEKANKTYVYRLYPNKTQEKRLLDLFRQHMNIYNLALRHRAFCYKACGESINDKDQVARSLHLRAMVHDSRLQEAHDYVARSLHLRAMVEKVVNV